MSKLHLTTGSQQPPKTDGKLRLYSMEYCPYAQRVRLVLRIKNIPFETVNLNLINKPEWYFQIHPEGQVPALDTGSQILIESLDIADYLEEKYPQNPLYPADEAAKKRDQDLIRKLPQITTAFYKCASKQDGKSAEEWAQEFTSLLEGFETELTCRGTPYFGGDNVGMVDLMLWPWAERCGTLAIAWGRQLPLEQDQLPSLRRWRKAMEEEPICKEGYCGPEKFWQVYRIKMRIAPPDYDNL